MATPKKKMSKSKRNMRRSHDALSASSYTECPKCGELVRPHHVCESCGYYNKKDVLVKKAK
jgi:large subunit ribosomal protein L32